ncbi:6,7-dimethyl-8-ribityllumazine synthase [Kinneretia aquatilis]|uniref:6,7-dimethyl-8-ribityllumazine synthase n=1 Tax=Kinneretia aquatilis TaxID=2070761 RepID=UPI0014953FC4|nr:6,7-dimethyl-8-ribityllumazine synthase [Paucibacter aquatile]WIV97816.1 6,7-dimethyl-8-ribityllumazine synthase [Paucibacter aquatile]
MNQTDQTSISSFFPSSSSSPAAADGAAPRIAWVGACWHRGIVQQACHSFKAELQRLGLPENAVDEFEVPGAFEIPLHAQRLARSGHYQAVLAGALVVDGGIYRHDFVAGAVIDGLMRVQLDSGVPVFSVVLTPHHFHEHEEHQQYFATHFIKKGQEAARACAQTLASLQRLPSPR